MPFSSLNQSKKCFATNGFNGKVDCEEWAHKTNYKKLPKKKKNFKEWVEEVHPEFLQEIAMNGPIPSFDKGWTRKGSKGDHKWSRDKKDMYHLNQTVPPATEDAGEPIKLGYDVYNVFQRYWEGQSDPLYALLSRRGHSVDWVTVFATPEEVKRLKEVANEILKTSKDEGEIRTAKACLERLVSSGLGGFEFK